MKTPVLILLFSSLLIIACKKKNPDPVIPKAAHSLKHSGIVDQNAFNLDTSSVSSQLIQMYQWDDFLFKEFEIQTWLKGPYLADSVFPGDERLTLDFNFILQYDYTDYDVNCSCLPTPSSNRLANYINSSTYDWNDDSERKEVQIIAWNNQFGDGSFQIFNPQISAQAIGNSIRIYGTIDSLEVGSLSNNNRFLKNLTFDYTVPINP